MSYNTPPMQSAAEAAEDPAAQQAVNNTAHDDLFPSNAMDSNLNYIENTTASSTRQRSILESIYTTEHTTHTLTSSWQMKALVLLCMLSLPGMCFVCA